MTLFQSISKYFKEVVIHSLNFARAKMITTGRSFWDRGSIVLKPFLCLVVYKIKYFGFKPTLDFGQAAKMDTFDIKEEYNQRPLRQFGTLQVTRKGTVTGGMRRIFIAYLPPFVLCFESVLGPELDHTLVEKDLYIIFWSSVPFKNIKDSWTQMLT